MMFIFFSMVAEVILFLSPRLVSTVGSVDIVEIHVPIDVYFHFYVLL